MKLPGDNYSKDPLKNTLLERAMNGFLGRTGRKSPLEYNTGDQILQRSQEQAFPDLRKQEIQSAAQPTAPTGLPAPPPAPPGTGRVPPAWKRYVTAQKMQDAVANNWTPNPTLVKILSDR